MNQCQKFRKLSLSDKLSLFLRPETIIQVQVNFA